MVTATEAFMNTVFPNPRIEEGGSAATQSGEGLPPPGYFLEPLTVQQEVFPFYSKFGVLPDDQSYPDSEKVKYRVDNVKISIYRDHFQIAFDPTSQVISMVGNGQPVLAYDKMNFFRAVKVTHNTNTYLLGVDYTLTADGINWNNAANIPPSGDAVTLEIEHKEISYLKLHYKSDRHPHPRQVMLANVGSFVLPDFVSPNERYDIYLEVVTHDNRVLVFHQNSYSVMFSALSVVNDDNEVIQFNAEETQSISIPSSEGDIVVSQDIDLELRMELARNGDVLLFWTPPGELDDSLKDYVIYYNLTDGANSQQVTIPEVSRLARTHRLSLGVPDGGTELALPAPYSLDVMLVPRVWQSTEADDPNDPNDDPSDVADNKTNPYRMEGSILRVIRPQSPNQERAPTDILEEYDALIPESLKGSIIDEVNKITGLIAEGTDSNLIAPGPATTLREFLKSDRYSRRYVDTLRNQFFLKSFYNIKGTDRFFEVLLKSFNLTRIEPKVYEVTRGASNVADFIPVPPNLGGVYRIHEVTQGDKLFFGYVFDHDLRELSWPVAPSDRPAEGSTYKITISDMLCENDCGNTVHVSLNENVTPQIMDFVDNLLSGVAAIAYPLTIRNNEVYPPMVWDCSKWDRSFWDGEAGADLCGILVYFDNWYEFVWSLDTLPTNQWDKTMIGSYLFSYFADNYLWDANSWDNFVWDDNQDFRFLFEYEREFVNLVVNGNMPNLIQSGDTV